MLRKAYTCDMCGQDVLLDEVSDFYNPDEKRPYIVKVSIPVTKNGFYGYSDEIGETKNITFCPRCYSKITSFVLGRMH